MMDLLLKYKESLIPIISPGSSPFYQYPFQLVTTIQAIFSRDLHRRDAVETNFIISRIIISRFLRHIIINDLNKRSFNRAVNTLLSSSSISEHVTMQLRKERAIAMRQLHHNE